MPKKLTADEALAEILTKIDEAVLNGTTQYTAVSTDLAHIKAVASAQQQILEEHMRRTAANEKSLGILTEAYHTMSKYIKEELEPLKRHVNMWGGAGKVLTVAGTLAGIAAAIYKFFM